MRVSHVLALPLDLCSLQAAVSSAVCQPFQSARGPVPEQRGKPQTFTNPATLSTLNKQF